MLIQLLWTRALLDKNQTVYRLTDRRTRGNSRSKVVKSQKWHLVLPVQSGVLPESGSQRGSKTYAGASELLMTVLMIRMMMATSLFPPCDDCGADKMRSLWPSQRFAVRSAEDKHDKHLQLVTEGEDAFIMLSSPRMYFFSYRTLAAQQSLVEKKKLLWK